MSHIAAISRLQDNIDEKQELLNYVTSLEKDRNFLLRILTQAIISHKGVLSVKALDATEAFTTMFDRCIEIVDETLCFEGELGSLSFKGGIV